VAEELAKAIEWTTAPSFDADDYVVYGDFLDREFSDGGSAAGAVQTDSASGGESERVREGIGGTACLAALVVLHLATG